MIFIFRSAQLFPNPNNEQVVIYLFAYLKKCDFVKNTEATFELQMIKQKAKYITRLIKKNCKM